MQFALQHPCLRPRPRRPPSAPAVNPYRARRTRRRRDMEASGRRIEVGRVIGEAFETYRNQAGVLLGGAVLVIGITSLIDNLLGLSGSIILFFAGVIIGLIGQVLYTG